MFEFFLRKIVFNNYDKESGKMLAKLLKKQKAIEYVSITIMPLILVMPLIVAIFTILKTKFYFALTAFIAIYILISLWFTFFFKDEIAIFRSLLTKKLYFHFSTCKGHALSKKDFAELNQSSNTLYLKITNQLTQGFCYIISFYILKILKKGCMKFLAVREVSTTTSICSSPNRTIHVIYVNNGWAFDPFSCSQFPLNKLLSIYDGEIFDTFYLKDVNHKSYQDFSSSISSDLIKWCKTNNVSFDIS